MTISKFIVGGSFGDMTIEGNICKHERGAFKDTKIKVLEGVREYAEEWDVELWRTKEGRLVVQAINEGGHNITQVDLLDLIEATKDVVLEEES